MHDKFVASVTRRVCEPLDDDYQTNHRNERDDRDQFGSLVHVLDVLRLTDHAYILFRWQINHWNR